MTEEKSSYKRLKDLPSYKDDSFHDFAEDVLRQKGILHEAMIAFVSPNKVKAQTVGILSSILTRQQECALSSIFLMSRKLFRDAAILILTLMELRLDLEYIGLDESHEAEWVSHEKRNTKC